MFIREYLLICILYEKSVGVLGHLMYERWILAIGFAACQVHKNIFIFRLIIPIIYHLYKQLITL